MYFICRKLKKLQILHFGGLFCTFFNPGPKIRCEGEEKGNSHLDV